ncbi:MAG: UvrD-helicase domain-containing protein [Bacteroidales bacterium]|nr:UvrD-helicase domain-containing protein [Bacteroidales bacterium]
MIPQASNELLIYKASAGSGKTFTLVSEFLKLALQSTFSFKHILAITFTNKAANEMKQRIINSLRELSQPEIYVSSAINHYLRPLLITKLNYTDEALSHQAEEVLSAILHNYSDLAVMTIDSFMLRILKTFTTDLDLPEGFETETDIKNLYQQALDKVIASVGLKDELTKTISAYVNFQVNENKAWNLKDTLLKYYAENLSGENRSKAILALNELEMSSFREAIKKMKNEEKFIEQSMQNEANKLIALLSQNHISPEDLHGKSLSFFVQIKKIKDKIQLFANFGNKYLKEAMEGKIAGKNAPAATKCTIEAISASLIAHLEQLEKLTLEFKGRYALIRSARMNLYPVSILNEVFKSAEAIRRENRLVYVDDFNDAIGKVVQNEAIPFIYERVGEWFHYIMIDEFQDTSLTQWQNLVPLVENALASGYSSLIVGDGKQAIYRWRNGNARQFMQLPELPGFPDNPLTMQREQTLKAHYHAYHLDRNFRSNALIVGFNNWFFNAVKANLPENYRYYYDHQEQKSDPEKSGGRVFVEITPYTQKMEEFRVRISTLVAEAIEQGYKYRDIAILCRTNEIASELATFLTNEGKPVIAGDYLLISGAAKVQLLLALIRCLDQPDNSADALAVLYHLSSINSAIDPPQLFHSRLFNKTDRNAVWDILNKFYPRLNKNPERLPLYDLTEHFIDVFIPQGQRDGYVRHFLDEIFRFTKNDPARANFPAYWEQHKKKAALDVPDSINALRVLTIHKAKGLEFPVVILPVPNSTFNLTRKIIWTEAPKEIKDLSGAVGSLFVDLSTKEKMQGTSLQTVEKDEIENSCVDNANLLYVAMTRASEQLYIICSNESYHAKGTLPQDMKEGSDMLVHIITTHPQFDSERKQLILNGTKTTRRIKESPLKTEDHSIQLQGYLECNNWQKHVTLSAPMLKSMEGSERNARDTGILMHGILAQIKSANDIEIALRKTIEQGIINKEEATHLRERITKLIAHPELKVFFDPKDRIFCEREILTPDQMAYRPDRVVLRNGSAMVADYKTGKPQPSHRQQIQNYGRLLTAMGLAVKRMTLIYLHEKGINLEEVAID